MPERNIDVRVRLKGADQFKSGMKQVEGGLSGFGGWLDVTKGILGSQVIQRGLDALVRTMKQSVDAAIQFESAAASLQKTAQLSDTALGNMEEQIMDLSERVPMTSTEIAELADTVAHLGLDEKQILPFTEVMIALGTATDMTAEQAATALAQLANVMHTTTDDYERLGSTIFELGRTSATTESAITEMATRMAGAASLVGMSEADALAYAAALSSIGVEAASGATSIQKMATRFELLTATGSDELEQFAQVAGMSAQEFTKAWQADPANTLAAFIDGLGAVNASGGSAINVLSELGITEVRLTRNIAGLAAAGDLLDRSLNTSRAAWEDNTALAEATGIAYGTTAAKMQMAQNAIENAQIAAGGNLKETALAIKELEAGAAKALRDAIMDNSLPKQLDELNAKYDETGASIANARDQAINLVDALAGLGDPAELDTAGMEQFEAIMGGLMQILPGVADLYDETTHTITGGAEALKDYAEQQYQIANSANEVQRSSEALEAYSAKQEKLTELRQQQALALAELQDAEREYYALVDRGASEQELTYSAEYERLMAADKAYSDVSKAVNECSGHLEQYAYIAEDAVAASESLSTAVSGASEGADAEAQAVEKLMGRLELYDQQAQEIANDYTAALEEAKTNVDKLFSRWNVGLYGPDKDTKPTMHNMLEDVDSQIAYVEKYQEMLEKAKELGLSQDIISELSDGSTQSFGELEAIVQDNGKSIDELNAKYEAAQAAKATFEESLAAAASDVTARTAEVETAVTNMVSNADQSTGAYSAAAGTIQAMIDGIDAKLGTLSSKVSEVNALNAQLAGAGSGGGGGDGSHAAGLSYVPFDGYLAQLHRGEMVLTALEARAWRAEQYANYGMIQSIESYHPAESGANSYAPNLAADIASGVGAVMSQAVERIAKRPTVLKVDGKTLASSTADYEAVAQNKRNKRYARGYGAGR